MKLDQDVASLLQFIAIILGALIGLVIGSKLNFTFNSLILSVLISMILTFFMISSIIFISFFIQNRPNKKEKDDLKWSDKRKEDYVKVININHPKYSSMFMGALFVAGGIFVALVDIVKDYQTWNSGQIILSIISTGLFLIFLILAFRWWVMLRKDIPLLMYCLN
ncbi:MAG: hypothetical protein Q8Q31_04025 [Nanoarchaeota archaeon]|nr:hypothetical protein [Nanoarchaeota archaeon]